MTIGRYPCAASRGTTLRNVNDAPNSPGMTATGLPVPGHASTWTVSAGATTTYGCWNASTMASRGARRDGVQVAAECIHVALKTAVDDEQPDHVRRQVHDEDDRENERVRDPDPEVQGEALHARIEPGAIDDRREQQHGDRREQRKPQRHEPADCAAEENRDLGRAIEPGVEPVAGLGHEAELARDPAVEGIENLSDPHEHQRRDDTTAREHDRRRRAHPERGPRHLSRREPERDVHEPQHRANAPVYSGTKNRSKFVHSRITMRMASFILSETPTRNPCVTSGVYGYHGIFS